MVAIERAEVPQIRPTVIKTQSDCIYISNLNENLNFYGIALPFENLPFRYAISALTSLRLSALFST